MSTCLFEKSCSHRSEYIMLNFVPRRWYAQFQVALDERRYDCFLNALNAALTFQVYLLMPSLCVFFSFFLSLFVFL